jgi:hypothetical protein
MGTGRILYPSTIRVWVWYCSTLPISYPLPSLALIDNNLGLNQVLNFSIATQVITSYHRSHLIKEWWDTHDLTSYNKAFVTYSGSVAYASNWWYIQIAISRENNLLTNTRKKHVDHMTVGLQDIKPGVSDYKHMYKLSWQNGWCMNMVVTSIKRRELVINQEKLSCLRR